MTFIPPARPLKTVAFTHLVPFDRANPQKGHEEALELFEYAEELGIDSGWVRTRHLQHGLSSPTVLFGALSQRTSKIQLGNAVIPMAFENPFRLAEDLATADVLTGSRVLPGVSAQRPGFDDELNSLIHGDGWPHEDYSYARVELRSEINIARTWRPAHRERSRCLKATCSSLPTSLAQPKRLLTPFRTTSRFRRATTISSSYRSSSSSRIGSTSSPRSHTRSHRALAGLLAQTREKHGSGIQTRVSIAESGFLPLSCRAAKVWCKQVGTHLHEKQRQEPRVMGVHEHREHDRVKQQVHSHHIAE